MRLIDKLKRNDVGNKLKERVTEVTKGLEKKGHEKSYTAAVHRPRAAEEVTIVARQKNDPSIEIPWSIRVGAAWSWRLLLIAALATAIGFVVIKLSEIVIITLVAIAFTVALSPLASFLRRKLRMPRALAAVTTIVVFLTAIVLLVAFAGRSILNGFADLSQQTVAGFQAVVDWLATGPLHLQQDQLDQYISEVQQALQTNASQLASGAISLTTSIGTIAAGAFIAVFMTIFFLMDGRKIWIWFVRLLPRTWREDVHEASIRGYTTLNGYVRASVAVALIDAIGIAAGAAILGIKLWLPIGIFVFIFAFIPLVGATLSGLVACLVVLVDKGFTAALIMLVIVLAVQQIEGHILQPFIMGSNVSLHPVAVVLGVAGGAYIAGIAGAVFAVPLMAFINTVALYLSGHDTYPELAHDENRVGGPPGSLSDQISKSYGYENSEALGDGLHGYVLGTLGEFDDDAEDSDESETPAETEPSDTTTAQ